eukprot:6328815-Amphidinium_carterae.1
MDVVKEQHVTLHKSQSTIASRSLLTRALWQSGAHSGHRQFMYVALLCCKLCLPIFEPCLMQPFMNQDDTIDMRRKECDHSCEVSLRGDFAIAL